MTTSSVLQIRWDQNCSDVNEESAAVIQGLTEQTAASQRVRERDIQLLLSVMVPGQHSASGRKSESKDMTPNPSKWGNIHMVNFSLFKLKSRVAYLHAHSWCYLHLSLSPKLCEPNCMLYVIQIYFLMCSHHVKPEYQFTVSLKMIFSLTWEAITCSVRGYMEFILSI